MAYATVSDVEALTTGRTFNATSKPSSTDVIGYLSETAAVLDGILAARGYDLPIPAEATSALELLEHYNAIGGWAFTETGAPSAQKDIRDRSAAAWAAAQKMLRDGTIMPVGVSKSAVRSGSRAGFTATALLPRDRCY